VNDAEVTFDGSVVSIVPPIGDLNPDITYYFLVDDDAVMNDLGDLWAPAMDSETWNFHTA